MAPGSPLAAALRAFALALVKRKTPDSNVTSSEEICSSNQIRSYVPPGLWPEAKPKPPLPTNSTILFRKVVSGSKSRVNDPFKKLCRRLESGHAPDSFNAGGQFRSI